VRVFSLQQTGPAPRSEESALPRLGNEAARPLSKGRLKNERGVALVEFALVLPLVMLLLLGMIDFGKAFTMWIDETHLANAAARYAAVNKNPAPGGTTADADIAGFEGFMEDDGDTKELRDSFDDPSKPANGVHVCLPTGSNGKIGDSIRVDVKATYRFLAFVAEIVPSLAGDKDITAHAIMRIEKDYSDAFIADAANHADPGTNKCFP
jgi:hypothetical protein